MNHSSLHLSTVELTLKHSAVNYFAAMIFPHPSLNFGLLHPQRITLSSQPGSLIISHLWLVGRTRPWELGWFELCYRARLSSADTVNRSFLKVILTFNTVMNNRQGSTENSKYMEKNFNYPKIAFLVEPTPKNVYIFLQSGWCTRVQWTAISLVPGASAKPWTEYLVAHFLNWHFCHTDLV